MALWTKSKLSTKPAVVYMSDTDRKALAFPLSSGDTIEDVTAELLALPDRTSTPASIESATVNEAGTGAVVIVKDLTYGSEYLLEVTLIRADLTTETGVLAIECDA